MASTTTGSQADPNLGGDRPFSRLKLSHELYLAFGLIVGVVFSFAQWSVLVAQRLTAQNRLIIEQAIPAIRSEVDALDDLAAVRRAEARRQVLRDPMYGQLAIQRARDLEQDLTRLVTFISTPAERQILTDVMVQFVAFRARAGSPAPTGLDDITRELEGSLRRLQVASSVELQRLGVAASDLEAQSRRAAVIAIGASIILGVLIAVFTAYRVSQPLRRLHTAVRAIEQRTQTTPLPVRGSDEIAELTTAFNRMAVRLHEHDELKQRLFSAITHDLRTPLMVIDWSAERLARRDSISAERQTTLVENIRINTAQLLNLVGQLLDLGKLQSGKLRLNLAPTDPRSMIQATVDEIRPWAADRGLRMATDWPSTLPRLRMDAQRIHQVLMNLLGNAVKFSQSSGTIVVSANATDEHLLITVADSGVGIPPDRIDKIFEQYEQAHDGHGGTGLGLAIVKAFVTAHGGRVWVESEVGRGSSFTFSLPLYAQVEHDQIGPRAPMVRAQPLRTLGSEFGTARTTSGAKPLER